MANYLRRTFPEVFDVPWAENEDIERLIQPQAGVLQTGDLLHRKLKTLRTQGPRSCRFYIIENAPYMQ